MTHEETAFMRAICADPEDDTARLVYADWLEEHGQAVRAGYIRHHIQQTPRPPELLDDSPSLEWMPVLDGLVRHEVPGGVTYTPARTEHIPCDLRFEFDRGFPWRVRCSPEVWHRYHAHIHWPGERHAFVVACQPVTHVVLTEEPVVVFHPVLMCDEVNEKYPFGTVRTATWTAACPVSYGTGAQRFGIQCVVDERERAMARSKAEYDKYTAEVFRRRIDDARTPMAYMHTRWPKLTFTLLADREFVLFPGL